MTARIIQKVLWRIQKHKVPAQVKVPSFEALRQGFKIIVYKLQITDINVAPYNRLYFHTSLEGIHAQLSQ